MFYGNINDTLQRIFLYEGDGYISNFTNSNDRSLVSTFTNTSWFRANNKQVYYLNKLDDETFSSNATVNFGMNNNC